MVTSIYPLILQDKGWPNPREDICSYLELKVCHRRKWRSRYWDVCFSKQRQ